MSLFVQEPPYILPDGRQIWVLTPNNWQLNDKDGNHIAYGTVEHIVYEKDKFNFPFQKGPRK